MFDGSVPVHINADPEDPEDFAEAVWKRWDRVSPDEIAECATLQGHELAPDDRRRRRSKGMP